MAGALKAGGDGLYCKLVTTSSKRSRLGDFKDNNLSYNRLCVNTTNKKIRSPVIIFST